jgi:hypothetical protein
MGRVLPIAPALPSLGALATTLKRYAKALAWARLTTPAPNPQPVGDTALLDASAMAERLQVPESWLREHARRGRIPCVYVGRYMRVDPDRVRRALDEQAAGVISPGRNRTA